MKPVYFESEDLARAVAKKAAEVAAKIADAESPNEFEFYRAEPLPILPGSSAPTAFEVASDEDDGTSRDAFAVVRLPFRPGTFVILSYHGATDETDVMDFTAFANYGIDPTKA